MLRRSMLSTVSPKLINDWCLRRLGQSGSEKPCHAPRSQFAATTAGLERKDGIFDSRDSINDQQHT